MLSIILNILLSILIIFLMHKGFEFVKHRLTNEETLNIGFYQSKKYDELIQELNEIKEHSNSNDNQTNDVAVDFSMENELSDFMNEL
jgi:hypothetical protein